MRTPSEGDHSDTVHFGNDAIRFIVYFTLASGVPVFAGIVFGIENHNAIIAIGACIVMVVVDIIMIFCVRRHEKQRQRLKKNKGTDAIYITRTGLTLAKLLVGGGIVLVGLGICLNLTSASTSWVSSIIGFIGGVLLLAAGFLFKRGIRDRQQ